VVGHYGGLVESHNRHDRFNVRVGTRYLQASTSLMHQPGVGILAQVDSLRDLYAAGLDRANRILQLTGAVLAAYAAVAVILFVLLVRTQYFLRRRFPRRRHPRLPA